MPIVPIDGFEALRKAAATNATDTFSLHLSAADEAPWRALIESDVLPRVVALASSGNSASGEPLPRELFESLAKCPGLSNLQQLAFGPAVNADALAAFAESPHLSSLIALHLRQVPVKLESVLALLGAFRGQLTWLRLEGLKLSPALTRAFTAAWPLLESLQLVAIPLGDEGAETLAGASMPALTDLDLSAASITASGAVQLAGTSFLDKVESLTMSRNPIGPQGAQAIAKSPHTRRLKHAWFAGCRVKDEGARAIASSGWKLETLDVSGCFLFNGAALASADFLGELTAFNIADNCSVFQDPRSIQALLDSKLAQQFKDDIRSLREAEKDSY
ncbi:MAG: hypothetical protein AB8H86_18550 [Polyangiales bacterium]